MTAVKVVNLPGYEDFEGRIIAKFDEYEAVIVDCACADHKMWVVVPLDNLIYL